MNRIVECVPNFSEGRNAEVVDAIAAAVASVPQVVLLAREMDADHNRAVLTIAGPPQPVADAAFAAVQAAAQRIDLTRHRGEHPRIGAADVVPFVPIRGVSLEECAAIARTVGQRIGEELGIPVYLYEAAASRPERVNLENVRRGQFELLQRAIETDPERRPDFGPARIHPTAGAVAVGARKPLLAYNINLATADVDIARRIARRIRHSSGGFRYVKAMGVFLKDRNLAQVSMNLTDYEQTPVELVFETVRNEAARYGVTIAGSEIIGLIPRGALERAAEHFLRIEDFSPSVVLENRIEAALSPSAAGGEAVRDFVERLGSSEPVPGGGSAAALTGAMGAALGQMAIRITQKKSGFESHAARFADALERLAAERAALLELIEADAAAYGGVLQAYRIPKGTPERPAAIQKAMIHATAIPARTAACAARALARLEELRPALYANVASDADTGMHLLRTSLRCAVANMQINMASIDDAQVRREFEEQIAQWRPALGRE